MVTNPSGAGTGIAWYVFRHQTARMLDDNVLGTATGGSTTTLVDAVRRKENDSFWVNAWCKCYSGTGSGQERVLSANTQSTGTLTHASTNWTTPDTTTLYELHQLMSALDYDEYVKDSLRHLSRGRKLWQYLYDSTSLTWVTDQFDYTVPTGYFALLHIEIQNVTGTPGTDDYDHIPDDSWHIREDSTRKIVFDSRFGQYTNGYKLRLTGLTEWAEPSSDADTYALDPYTVAVTAAALLATAQGGRSGLEDRRVDRLLQLAERAQANIPDVLPPSLKWVFRL